MTGQPFLLGPLGAAVELDTVPEASVSSARATSDLVTMSGARYVQRSRFAPREWSLTLSPWSDPRVVRVVQAAAQGVLGDVWLWDLAACRVNMLSPHVAAGRGGVPLLVDGVPLFPVSGGQHVPVRAFTSVTVSFWTDEAEGTPVLSWAWGAGADTSVVAPDGAGPRRGAVTLTPTVDTYLVLEVEDGAAVTGLRVFEGQDDFTGWLPGQGSPCRVVVVDPEQTMHRFPVGGHGLSDWTVTVREVGAPGAWEGH